METHAAGCTQCSEDGREDADEGLENELPEVLLTIEYGREESEIDRSVQETYERI